MGRDYDVLDMAVMLRDAQRSLRKLFPDYETKAEPCRQLLRRMMEDIPTDKVQKTLTRQQVDEWTDADTATAKEIVAFFKDGTVKLQNDCNFYAAWLKHKVLKED